MKKKAPVERQGHFQFRGCDFRFVTAVSCRSASPASALALEYGTPAGDLFFESSNVSLA